MPGVIPHPVSPWQPSLISFCYRQWQKTDVLLDVVNKKLAFTDRYLLKKKDFLTDLMMLIHSVTLCASGFNTGVANMASANVTLENQLHSAQKNLLFLQQDHANTLKGLHAEIRRLQQQCTGEHTCVVI